MPAGKTVSKAIALLVIASILLSSPPNIHADYKDDILAAAAGNLKDYMLAKARVDLIARLEKTQPELAGFLKEIDAPTWGRWAGEISVRNGNVVFEEIVQKLKKAATAEIEKKKNELMKDLYKRGKEHAISKGVLGEDTKKYIELAEEYGFDALKIAENTYSGDFKGAGDIVINKMKEKLQVKTKELLTGAVTETIDFFLKDLAGQSVGGIYLQILELEMEKIEEFKKYSIDYFGTFSVLEKGREAKYNWCSIYRLLRSKGHGPDAAFNYQLSDSPLPDSISALFWQANGLWYSSQSGETADRPTAKRFHERLELCYVQSKVMDKATLQSIIDATRANADRKLFLFIQKGMELRIQELITIINATKFPTFSLVVTVLDAETNKEASGATVTVGSAKKDAPLGVATYAGLGPDTIGDSITIAAEAKGYVSGTQSFTFRELADKFDKNKLEVQVGFPLKPDKKPPEDFTIDVTVTDKNTGDKLPGAKVTLDGETMDAANGVASYTRKSSMLDPANSSNEVRVSAGATGYQEGTASPTVGELAGKLNKATGKVEITIPLEPEAKSGEVDRLEVHCGQKEIFEDDAATCSATVYLKSGQTRDVSAGAKWTPDFVDSFKGTVKGQEAKAKQPLPHTVKAEARYAASAEEGGKEWIASDTVLVKPLSARPQPKIGIRKAADRPNAKAGEKVTYTYTVSNPGKAALDSVKVTDDKCSPVRYLGGDANNNGTLEPNEAWTYECSAVLNATTKNTATAEGSSSGQKVTEQTTATVTVGLTEAGKVDRFEVICGPAEIFEDEVAICNAKVHYDSGKTKDVSIESNWTPPYVQLSNGTVRGDEVKKISPLPYRVNVTAAYDAPPEGGGKSWVGQDNVLVKPVRKAKAGIKIQKAVDAAYRKPGETATYAYSVTNTGEVELNAVRVADDQCSPVQYLGGDKRGSKRLGPNDTWTYECSAVLKATTVNTAVVEAYSPSNEKVTDKATAKVTVAPCPPPKVPVPYVIDRTEGDAITELKKDSLQGKVNRREYSKRIKDGAVMEQDPAAGECVDPESVVGLAVSRGPEPEEPAKPAQLTAELDCGKSFELAPGDPIGRTCGIIVRGWDSRTENRVEVKVEYDKGSGIEVFPGDTGVMGTQMYRAGIQEHPDRYIFSEHFTAKENAPPGKTTVAITVGQEGAGSVKFTIDIAVLKKGLLPSTGPGIRPPADAKQGSGGPYCVWRYKLIGDAPACFHYHVAACAAYPYRPAYELVGQNMTWGEADARAGELSRYFGDQYGCEGAVEKPAGIPPPPAVVKQGSGGDRCVWRHHPFGYPPACFEFHNAPCTAYPNRKDYEVVGQNMTWGEADARIEELSSYFKDQYGCQEQQKALADCSRIQGSTLVTEKASGKVSCQCPGGTMLNKAGDACIPDVQTQIGKADCSDLPGTSPQWDPGAERVYCVCPEGTKWFEDSCKTDQEIKLAQTDCSGRPGTSPQWDPGIEQWSCECPAGTQWYKNACTSEKDIRIAETDCSMYSGTSPQWNESAGNVECVCPAGTNWFDNACVPDQDIAAARADCSGMPGTSPQWDGASGKVLCVCPAGTKWFDNACVPDQDIAVARADCSGMPGTSPQWDEASGKVLCVCPAGTKWDPSRQMCHGEERTPPATAQGATTRVAAKDFYVAFKVHMPMPTKWPQFPKVPADADAAEMERYRKQVKKQLEDFSNSLTLSNTVIEAQDLTKTAVVIHLSGTAIPTYNREIFSNGEKFALPFNGSGKDADGKPYSINGAILLSVAGSFDAKEKAQAAYPAAKQVIEINTSNGTFVHQSDQGTATGGPLTRGWSQANQQKSLALTKLLIKLFGGQCFVATAVYGDAFAPELDVLRKFRDTVLLSSADGVRLVNAYYKYGPLLAEKVRRYPFVIRPLRSVLNFFVGWLRHADQDHPVTRTATRFAVKVAWKVVSLFVEIEPDAGLPDLPFPGYPYRIKATTD